MKIRFVSRNKHKLAEAQTILEPLKIEVIPVNLTIEELQTVDTSKLVRDKALRAFGDIGHPLFVEHTGLKLSLLNGLPGGLTQIFWDTLEADKFARLFGTDTQDTTEAVTDLCFIDGRKFHEFRGSVKGRISKEPKGPRDFQWDSVFIPNGAAQTFAEMGPERKNRISMRRKALDLFAEFLKSGIGHAHS
jgi:XTP/dITP diphosphohydrolase